VQKVFKINIDMKTLPLDTKIKLLQAFVYLGFIYTLVWQFDWVWLVAGLLFGWLATLIGISCGLHKYSAHRSFEAKNNFGKGLMLFFATIMSLGSTIAWSTTHRKHHQLSDKDGDPHSPNQNASWWRSIKLWFYYFPTYHVSVREVRDLMSDPMHKFFHNNYFKIIFVWIILLALIDVKALCYFYFVAVVYGFQATSYITVLAHKTWLKRLIGYTNFESGDNSFNSKLAAIFCPCDGNHNNHHTHPGAARNALGKGEWDTGYWFIRLVGRVPDQTPWTRLLDNESTTR